MADEGFFLFMVLLAWAAITVLSLRHGARSGRFAWVVGMSTERGKHPAAYRVWQVYLLLQLATCLSFIAVIFVDRAIDEPAGLVAIFLCGVMFFYGASVLAYYAVIGFRTGESIFNRGAFVRFDASRTRHKAKFWVMQLVGLAFAVLIAGLGAAAMVTVVRLAM